MMSQPPSDLRRPVDETADVRSSGEVALILGITGPWRPGSVAILRRLLGDTDPRTS